jgi:threonine dehydrogenase-like Zn-dependent dehydrogenase
MTDYALTVTAREQIELAPDTRASELGPGDLRGTTLVSLISPGTEIAHAYCGTKFPAHLGYAAVFTVAQAGAQVSDIEPGAVCFCPGGHRSAQQMGADDCLPVPPSLTPEHAVIARLMGVSMTTLITTRARPGDLVMVSGAGPIGYLAAHIFRLSGYDVVVVEPDATRRAYVEKSGITRVFPAVPHDDPTVAGNVALAVECSGHEQAVLDACGAVRKAGEVVLVGVPWRQRTELSMHALLWQVFHRYVYLRSGWEWELPRHPGHFQPQSIYGCYARALQWLAQGAIPLAGLLYLHDPRNCQDVYQSLLHGTAEGLFQVFDWRLVE